MKVPSVDSAHHQSKVPSVDGAHQKSSYVRIQGIDKEQEKHHGHEQLHHYHNLVEQKPQHHSTKQIKENLSTSQQSKQVEQSHVLTIEEMSPIFQWTNSKGKTKVLNLYGLYNLFIIAATLPFWLLSMEILQRLGDSIEGFDDNRAKFDYSGKIWCRTYLRLVDSYPELAGDVSRLKDKENGGYGGACLFVANHASFLDIAVLCTVLDPVFKFIAKDSLVKFPGVGKQLLGVSYLIPIGPFFVTEMVVITHLFVLFPFSPNRENMFSLIEMTNVPSFAHSNKQSIISRMVYPSWHFQKEHAALMDDSWLSNLVSDGINSILLLALPTALTN